MENCPSCGAELRPDAVECPECGTAIREATAEFAPVGASLADRSATEAVGADGPVLIVRKGPEVGERFYLDRPRLTVGRDPQSGIFLNDITVSREHAVLTLAGGEVTIEDVGSLNGVYVNGASVTRTVLADGDSVQVGRFQMMFCSGGGE